MIELIGGESESRSARVDVLNMLKSEGHIQEKIVTQLEGGVEDTPRLFYSSP